ncbi:MAG: class I SAM-dependent methyltransferase [bacterium]|nr:class I SAM-dependent methyltransferase [bacterium]
MEKPHRYDNKEDILSQLDALLKNDYLVVQIGFALERIGFFKLLEERGKINFKEIVELLKVREDYLRVCTDFLWAASSILERDKDFFSLKYKTVGRGLWWLAAYKPVLDNLAGLLTGEKLYGRDVKRIGHYLQKASDLSNQDAADKALYLLRNEGGILVDMGCGSAHTLITYCQEKAGRYGVGIDVDPETVQEARRHVKGAALEGSISIVESDAFEVERWRDAVLKKQKVLFLLNTVLHEFFRNGDEAVAGFLQELKKEFQDSKLIIIEFDAWEFSKIKEEKDRNKAAAFYAARYQLVHPLTDQGMPRSRKEWEDVIKKGGWQVKDIIPAEYNLVIYNCA